MTFHNPHLRVAAPMARNPNLYNLASVSRVFHSSVVERSSRYSGRSRIRFLLGARNFFREDLDIYRFIDL